MRKVLLALIILALGKLTVAAASETSPVDSLMCELKVAKSPSDSLKILFDLFDVQQVPERTEAALQVLNLSARLKDYDSQLDILRQIANIGVNTNDIALIDRGIKSISSVPDSEEKRQTLVFLHASRATAETFSNTPERENYTRQQMKIVGELPENSDPYEKVSRLFTIVTMLSGETHGELLTDYLNQLDAAIKALPQLQNNFLRSKFNTVASLAYWQNDENLKAVRIDRNQLLNIKRLEQLYADKGRKFRNFDFSRYINLLRIIRNQKVLSDAEFNDAIAQVEELAAKNEQVANDYPTNPIIVINRLIREKRYKEALPLAFQDLANAQNIYQKRFAVRQLLEIARNADDPEALQRAEAINSEVLAEYVNVKTAERVRELELLSDVNDLRQSQLNARLQKANDRNLVMSVALGIIAFVLLATGGYFLYKRRTYRRRLTGKLTSDDDCAERDKKIAQLEKQLDEARRRETEKIQLMTYIAHELSTPLAAITNYSQMILDAVTENDVKGYIRGFANIIDANTKVVQTVTNDMLEFALNESKPMVANRAPVEPNKIAEIAAETIEPRLGPGFSISVKPAANNPVISSDPRRAQLLLLACVDSLVRSLRDGHVTIGVAVTDKGCRFTISAAGATPGGEAAKLPRYPSTMEVLKATVNYNPEIPSITVSLGNL